MAKLYFKRLLLYYSDPVSAISGDLIRTCLFQSRVLGNIVTYTRQHVTTTYCSNKCCLVYDGLSYVKFVVAAEVAR